METATLHSEAHSSLVPIAAAVAAIFGASALLLLWRKKQPKALPKADREELDAAVKSGTFTVSQLAHFDGRELPVYLGVCGKIVDCSSSENIKAGEGYGKLWAGRDATYALATLSLVPDDANKFDFELSDFTPDQHKALAGWYKHFTTKYPVVGRLKEYDGWDFSSVEEEAVSQTPFGAPAGPAGGPAKAPEKKEASAGIQLSAGDRVIVTECEGRPDLNGATGVLTGFVKEKNCFSVTFNEDDVGLVKPTNLMKSLT
mmetsp:Transcript_40888/g.89495  ORF Transcript_40888/g.89495 Transcript_40888/m.89495 type:complete len:258 (-) Transcript_40888:202-975(-)|eukprot:CAMPEP_0170602888 /NCGR_PEP_ID=MMETSP0224-20130122/18628_1 /TAXON_ID=285029 /ORGANISM="Togula jolla, Strain CCCM 725" /LENGTH=257 /DNA_ID=CAMNT_0010927751 /DNA_START=37 /DNA_END=810 /DNA_ORIENTATION=+